MYFFNVVCKTEKCGNENIVIEVPHPNNPPYVICGVCSKDIVDITFIREEKENIDNI